MFTNTIVDVNVSIGLSLRETRYYNNEALQDLFGSLGTRSFMTGNKGSNNLNFGLTGLGNIEKK